MRWQSAELARLHVRAGVPQGLRPEVHLHSLEASVRVHPQPDGGVSHLRLAQEWHLHCDQELSAQYQLICVHCSGSRQLQLSTTAMEGAWTLQLYLRVGIVSQASVHYECILWVLYTCESAMPFDCERLRKVSYGDEIC